MKIEKYVKVSMVSIPADGKPGEPGKDGVSTPQLILDPPVICIDCDANGNPKKNISQYTTYARVFLGADMQSGWTFSIQSTNECRLTLTNNLGFGLVSPGAVTADQASAVIKAVKGSESLTATLTFSKVYDGRNGTNGTNGTNGRDGVYVLPPRHFNDYPSNYQFQSGKEPTDTHIDVVMFGDPDENGFYDMYQCITTHLKSFDNGSSLSSLYWRAANKAKFIATELLLANNAYINLLSTQGMRIFDLSGNIVGQISSVQGGVREMALIGSEKANRRYPLAIGGKYSEGGVISSDPLFALNDMGRSFFGGLSGKHIEIDPDQKQIQVFSGENDYPEITISGDKLSVDDVTGASGANVSPTNFTAGQSITNTTSVTSQELKPPSNGGVTPLMTGVMTATFPPMTLRVRKGAGMTANSNGLLLPEQTCVYACIYINNTLQPSLKRRIAIGDPSNLVSGNELTVSIPSVSISANLVPGQIARGVILMESVFSSGGTATLTLPTSGTPQIVHSYNVPNRRNVYGRNGFFISSDTKNYVYFIIDDSGILRAKCVSNGATIFG